MPDLVVGAALFPRIRVELTGDRSNQWRLATEAVRTRLALASGLRLGTDRLLLWMSSKIAPPAQWQTADSDPSTLVLVRWTALLPAVDENGDAQARRMAARVERNLQLRPIIGHNFAQSLANTQAPPDAIPLKHGFQLLLASNPPCIPNGLGTPPATGSASSGGGSDFGDRRPMQTKTPKMSDAAAKQLALGKSHQ